MKTFIFTSSQFTGEIIFNFDGNGFLKSYSNMADLDCAQIAYLLTNLPKHVDEVEVLRTKSKTISVKEITVIPTFEEFWDKYGFKEDKQEAMQKWKKLTDKEKVEAYEYISVYKNKLKQSRIAMKYAKTYLHNRPWIR